MSWDLIWWWGRNIKQIIYLSSEKYHKGEAQV